VRDPRGFCLISGNPFTTWNLTPTIAPEKEAKILTPVLPSKIVAVGLNYISHAREMNMALPSEPLIFLKPPSSLANPGDAIPYPLGSQRVDFEGELALVIGKKAKNILEKDFAQYLLGYTLANDVTARDFQKQDGQWARAKGFDGFCPLGPSIATEIDPAHLEFETSLNDELKQTGRISDLIFSIPKIVAFISNVMTLLPGDVILTGTPLGSGPMRPGDRVRVECESIGVLENTLQA
jgi:2-keto-4-pentenoate hydratase/2-oxohepta-3-ene-1,7-dioic acid hydratase in catechol pathway